MRRVVISLIFLFTLLTFLIQPVFAQTAPSPQPDLDQPQQQAQSASLTPKQNAIQTITTIKDFVTSADKLLGGFIFYTPDVFANTITLKDGTTLPGLSSYRNIFYTISIPLIALAVAYFALKRLSNDTPFALQSLIKRLVLVAIMFIVTPILLSYSIQANNLLVNQISSNQTFSTFITDFLNNEQQQINNGADPKQFGIPDSQPSILGVGAQSFWQFILQAALFLIALLFFLIGFLFIAFQFIIRFASLLFLSVLYPIAIPFAISEKTEGITNTYFKTWFMFLIHQPAFVLGYILAIGFLQAILKTNGASLGMIFFYSGFLFFLGGVSALVTHIFGTSWTAISANLQAAMVSAPIGKSLGEFKRGAITGNASGVRSYTGKQVGDRIRAIRQKYLPGGASLQGANALISATAGASQTGRYVQRQNLSDYPNQINSSDSKSQPVQKQTVSVAQDRAQYQTVQVKQDGYSVTNKKTGMTTTYLSPSDAKADGYNSKQLNRTSIDGNYVNWTSQPTGKTSPAKVRELISTNRNTFDQEGIHGVITKSPSRKTKENITRIYSKEIKV